MDNFTTYSTLEMRRQRFISICPDGLWKLYNGVYSLDTPTPWPWVCNKVCMWLTCDIEVCGGNACLSDSASHMRDNKTFEIFFSLTLLHIYKEYGMICSLMVYEYCTYNTTLTYWNEKIKYLKNSESRNVFTFVTLCFQCKINLYCISSVIRQGFSLQNQSQKI